MTLTHQLADFVVETTLRDLPDSTIGQSKAVILDYLACALAGSTAKGVRELSDVSGGVGAAGDCTLLVLGGRADPRSAALFNATVGHALDFDDTHDRAIVHTSTVVVPAALALAEARGASGEEFLLAVLVGMELHCRLALAATVQPVELGWIYTPLMGVFGAAAASAKVLRLDADCTLNAFGLAYSLASGNHQALNEGTLAKRLQAGFASSNGVLAALLSEAGLSGPHQPFEGRFGLFNVYLRGNVDPANTVAHLGEMFEVDALSLKPYPCCRHTHTAIDAMVDAYHCGVRAESVAEIEIFVNEAAYAAVCEPRALKYTPHTIVDAQFSIPYTAACALAGGWVYIDDFTPESIGRREILALASKVKPAVDPQLKGGDSRQITPARAVVRFADGRQETFSATAPKGSPSNRMTEEECAKKLLDCASHARTPFTNGMLRDLRAAVNTIERERSVAGLLEALSPAMTRAAG